MKKLIAFLMVMMMVFSFAAVAEEDNRGWHNILLLGDDSRDSSNEGRTDTIMILSINREESLLKMTSIMRDVWVSFPGTSKSGKINAANVYGGPELAIKTVNEYFGMDIEDYVLLGMYDLVDIVDLVGGIDIEITETERNYINGKYSEATIPSSGMVHLNGTQTMIYARERYTDSDHFRVMRQQSVILALANTLQNMEVDALMELTDKILSYIVTNMEDDEIKDLATVGLVIEVEEVGQHKIPADGTYESGTYNGTWKIKANFEKNEQLLHEFIYGE